MDLTVLANQLKVVYAPLLTDLTKRTSNILTVIPDGGKSATFNKVGKYTRATVSITVRNGDNVRFAWAGDEYPEQNFSETTPATLRMTELRATLHFGRIELQTAQLDEGSFYDPYQKEVQSTAAVTGEKLAAAIFGLGGGKLAVCGTTSAANDVVLASTTTKAQWNYLRRNMRVDIGTVASPTTVAGGRTITAVNQTAGTITISGAAVTTSSSHFLFAAGDGGTTANGNRAITSLREIAGTASIYDVDVTEYPEYVGYQNTSGSARSATFSLFDQIKSDFRNKQRAKNPTHCVTTNGVFAHIASSQMSNIRYMDNANDINLDVEAIKLAGIIVFADDYCWDGEAWFFEKSSEDGLHLLAQGDFKPEDNQPIQRVGDQNTADMYRQVQLFAPNRTGVGYANKLSEAY